MSRRKNHGRKHWGNPMDASLGLVGNIRGKLREDIRFAKMNCGSTSGKQPLQTMLVFRAPRPMINIKNARNSLEQSNFRKNEIVAIISFCEFFNSSNDENLEDRIRKAVAGAIKKTRKIKIKPEMIVNRHIKSIVSNLNHKGEDFYSSILESLNTRYIL